MREGSALRWPHPSASIVLLLAGCGGPLRLAGGPVAGVTTTALGPGEVAWTCGLRGEGTWVAVDLALENRGAVPVRWPEPSAPALVEVDADPAGDCTLRVYDSTEPPLSTIEGTPWWSLEVAPGATSHLLGGFAVVAADPDAAPEMVWSRDGPTLALAPGERCRVVCSSVYWPGEQGAPPPPRPDGSRTVSPELLGVARSGGPDLGVAGVDSRDGGPPAPRRAGGRPAGPAPDDARLARPPSRREVPRAAL